MQDMTRCWADLDTAAERLAGRPLADLFADDPDRFEDFSARADDLLVDFSKEKLDRAALDALLALADAAGVADRRDAMFRGEKINATEGRAVLHTALRQMESREVLVDGHDVMPDVVAERDRMLAFAEEIRTGAITALDGAPFTDVINLGIGGSDLGPAMATEALAPWHDGPRVHYVSNVDGAHLAGTVRTLDPTRTLVIVASKSFTTQETMMNARSAKAWLATALGDRVGQHMAAVSTNLSATADFGINDARVFGFWDWVGGRYSVWSSIGLPLAIAIGPQAFRAFLTGAAGMDRHFRTAPLAGNLPVLLALIGVWRRNVLGYPAVAVIPYDQRLARFPAFLQQLDMESSGKRVTQDGSAVGRDSGPVVFGEPGTNAQHSFFQLLHQGTGIIPVDFLLAARPVGADAGHHQVLAANALAQSAALAFGDPSADDPHRVFPGDRPSTTILYDRLDPHTLGRLIALCEHRVFVQGILWGINSFDQYGVELGKVLARRILPALEGAGDAGMDASTAALIQEIQARGEHD